MGLCKTKYECMMSVVAHSQRNNCKPDPRLVTNANVVTNEPIEPHKTEDTGVGDKKLS